MPLCLRKEERRQLTYDIRGAVGQKIRAPEHKGAIARAIGSLCRRERENRPAGAKRPIDVTGFTLVTVAN